MVEIANPNADVMHHCDLRSRRTRFSPDRGPVCGSKNQVRHQVLRRRTIKDDLQRHGAV
jgi:hypothetical protein